MTATARAIMKAVDKVFDKSDRVIYTADGDTVTGTVKYIVTDNMGSLKIRAAVVALDNGMDVRVPCSVLFHAE